jgi:3'-5' exoribonuclease 1
MRYIIVDLEATCWQSVRDRQRMEIIEIGAVELHAASEPYTRDFSCFVRPVVEPTLSDFCLQLTSIRQKQVDFAATFREVFPAFLNWIGADPFVLCLRSVAVSCGL